MTSDTASQIAYLARALKAPALRDSAERLAATARDAGWTHQEYLAACLEAEVATRGAHGAENRIRAAGFPARKTIEDFDFDHQRSVKRDHILHLATLDFITARTNIVLLGPPGTGKTMLATGLGIKACQAGHRVLFATAAAWTDRLTAAHRAGRIQQEITRLGRYPLLVIDEIGYIPVRARGRQPVLPAHLRPLRDRQRHRHQQQAVQRLGRDLRRRHRCRRHDRQQEYARVPGFRSWWCCRISAGQLLAERGSRTAAGFCQCYQDSWRDSCNLPFRG